MNAKGREVTPWDLFKTWRRRLRLVGETPAQRAGRMRKAGDKARSRGDWTEAAEAYAGAIAANPPNGALSVQLGHALKEAGRTEEAIMAYEAAALDATWAGEAQLHLGALLEKLGRRSLAIAAYAACLRPAPVEAEARNALLRLGARERLPDAMPDRRVADAAFTLAATSAKTLIQAQSVLSEASVFPQSGWNRFKSFFPLTPPPTVAQSAVPVVLIDARGSPAWAIRTTLDSLADQTHEWIACILAPAGADALANHSVGAVAALDRRISFHADAKAAFACVPADAPAVLLSAGARLEPSALAWLSYAADRTSTALVYADHDRFRQDWRLGRTRFSPALFPTPDQYAPVPDGEPPALLWVAPDHRTAVIRNLSESGHVARRSLISELRSCGPIGHLPRVLASLSEGLDLTTPSGSRRTLSPPDTPPETLSIIIPTHNQATLLTAGVGSLFDHALSPDRLRVRVVQNRPTAETRAAVQQLLRRAGVDTMEVDEPFNWSRLNGLGAEGLPSDILVFMNDDVAMKTRGWDERLRVHLRQPTVGAVGARLLYPDGTIQHAGIVFGRDENGPIHEGVGEAGAEGGPLGRWLTPHAASAVTGAFLACKRETYEAVGGFDTRFAIGFNDIDFCLKARAAGLDVLYAADIEAEHHESPTRGLNDTPDRVRWDRDELFDLHRKWGDALFDEPGINPQWASSTARPYDGFREPSLSEVLSHLDRSARERPWSLKAQATP